MKNPLALTREDITAAADSAQFLRRTKWTVVIGEKELPVRPILFEALGVRPDYAMNSYQAIGILMGLGFEIRFKGKAVEKRLAVK
jgi:hypothetical protein